MAHQTNLPIHLTSFVGRKTELEGITTLLTHNRLVTLSGPGGVGKSRLAIRVGRALLDRFPDGVWMVDLSMTDDPDAVPTTIAAPFGVRDQEVSGTRKLVDVLADYLAEAETLLIVDNCEQVRRVVSSIVETILTRTTHLRVLTTSRGTLSIAGEIVYRVPPLTVTQDTGQGVHTEATRLFYERAEQVAGLVHRTGEDLHTVVEITKKLDGLPLAIELAASRANIFSPQEILNHLEDRFAFLDVTPPTVAGRHETLQETMDWSYQLLTESEQEGLRRLAVFHGWTLEAVRTVLDEVAHDTLRLLESLVEKSLVEVSRQGATNRYSMLETIRQFALDKLQSDNEHSARLAHAEYYCLLAEEGDQNLTGPDQAKWLRRMRVEHSNILGALEWAIEAGEDDLALRLIIAVGWFWFMDGYWQGPRDWFYRVYEATEEADPTQRARSVYRTGGFDVIMGRYSEIRTLVKEAYSVLFEHGTPTDKAYITFMLGAERAAHGEPDGFELLEESIERFEDLGDPWGAAFAKRWMGGTRESWHEEVIDLQRQSVQGFKKLEDRWSAAWSAVALGYNLLAVGSLEEARTYLEESLELVAEIQDAYVVPHAKRGLGLISAREGALELASSTISKTLPLFAKIGDDYCTFLTHTYLAEIAIEMGNHAEAIEHLTKILEDFEALGELPSTAAACLRLVAELCLATGGDDMGARLLGAATSIQEQTLGGMGSHEQNQLDVSIQKARKALGEDFDELWDEGASWDVHSALDYARRVRALRLSSEVGSTELGQPLEKPESRSQRLNWPSSYLAIRGPVMEAWGVEGDILLHRELGGKSGAYVFSVDVTCEGFSGQAILKLDAVEGDEEDNESVRHQRARERAPEYAGQHLPEIVNSYVTEDHSVTLFTIAAQGLEYSNSWSGSPFQTQLEVSGRLGHDLLAEWNADYALAPSLMSPQDLLADWLDYRLDPERGRVYGLLDDLEVPASTATLYLGGEWYPNPLAFATGSEPGPNRLALRAIAGHTHGDLHGHNVLVTESDQQLDYFLIDLAFYDPDNYLFFDHAYFELNHLLERRVHSDPGTWMAILDAVSGNSPPEADDLGLVSLNNTMRATIEDWIEHNEPNRRSYLESQLLLARVAVGLNFAHKRIEQALKVRGFLYAMKNLKEYLRFHQVDWPEDGVVLRLLATA